MKVPKKGEYKKNKVNKKGAGIKIKPKKEQVLVVAQEFKYARLLAGNEKSTRDRVLKALKKWITNCFEKGYEFKEDDFTRVWKGLFYAVWMSDKPLIQEELCENIASILDLFPPEQLRHALLMTKAGFKMLATEWYGIDQHRMDKFLMLVRRYLRASLRCVRRCGWRQQACRKYADMLSGTDGVFAVQTPHYARNAVSMLLHIADCFLEELAKVSEGDIDGGSVAALLRPFVTYTCRGGTGALCCAARRLLTALLRQSPHGLSYQEKTRAWQKMGCPGSGPDALQPASDDEDSPPGAASDDEHSHDGEKALDPRAGRVDVELPLLPVPADLLAGMLRDMLGQSTSKAHKRVKICLQRFESLSSGQYPLRVTGVGARAAPVKGARAVRALAALDDKLKRDTDELKLRGLSRKHRKRLLKKARAGLSIVEDVAAQHKHKHTHKHKNGEWVIESTTTETEEKDSSDKENQNKNKNKTKNKSKKRKLESQQNGDVANKKVKINNESATKDKIKDISSKKKDMKHKNVKQINTDSKSHKMQEYVISKQMQKNTEADKPQMKHKVDSDNPQKVKDATKINESPKIKVDKKKETKSTELKPKKQQNAKAESPKVFINKLKNFQKQIKRDRKAKSQAENTLEKDIRDTMYDTPKRVKFVLKNNSMQKPLDYYKSVRQSPSIPFDSAKKPTKTNLKPSTPSPINPFFKKKLRLKHGSKTF